MHNDAQLVNNTCTTEWHTVCNIDLRRVGQDAAQDQTEEIEEMAIQKKSLISALKTAKSPKAASATPEAVTASNKKAPARVLGGKTLGKTMGTKFARFARVVE